MKSNKMARKAQIAKKMTLRRAERRGNDVAAARASHEAACTNGDAFAHMVTLTGIDSHRKWNRYVIVNDRLRSMSTDNPEYFSLSAEKHGLVAQLTA